MGPAPIHTASCFLSQAPSDWAVCVPFSHSSLGGFYQARHNNSMGVRCVLPPYTVFNSVKSPHERTHHTTTSNLIDKICAIYTAQNPVNTVLLKLVTTSSISDQRIILPSGAMFSQLLSPIQPFSPASPSLLKPLFPPFFLIQPQASFILSDFFLSYSPA